MSTIEDIETEIDDLIGSIFTIFTKPEQQINTPDLPPVETPAKTVDRSVPLNGDLRGSMHELIFREAPSKQHTIPCGVICHTLLPEYKPWDDDRLGGRVRGSGEYQERP